MEIKIKGHHFDLLPQKAMFWKETQTLLIGDLHLGKITHFRSEGFALPSAAAADNFERLNFLLQHTGATRIIFLGDLFHNRYNSEWDTFASWRHQHQFIDMLIVMGNHDILPKETLKEINIAVFEEQYEEEGFVFKHHPQEVFTPNQFVFAGHVHPVFKSYGKGRQRFRLPCFVVDQEQAILPSFGVFTGGFAVELIKNRTIYLATDAQVFKLG
jgi:DNA ligase-associated metallophosphoesterase